MQTPWKSVPHAITRDPARSIKRTLLMLSVRRRLTFEGQSIGAQSGESSFGPVVSRTFTSRSRESW